MSPSLNILGPVPSWLLAPKTATQSKLSDNYPRIEEIFAVMTVSTVSSGKRLHVERTRNLVTRNMRLVDLIRNSVIIAFLYSTH